MEFCNKTYQMVRQRTEGEQAIGKPLEASRGPFFELELFHPGNRNGVDIHKTIVSLESNPGGLTLGLFGDRLTFVFSSLQIMFGLANSVEFTH